MAPTPEEMILQDKPTNNDKYLTGEEVVISGMSGIFPSSDSVKQFMDHLYNNVDMVERTEPSSLRSINQKELPVHFGKMNDMDKFDAQFFKVHYKQARSLDPMARKLLEHAYSAIYDSGINPMELRGRKVAVYIGSTASDLERTCLYESFLEINGFALTGICKSMYANRISYWLDLKGPSYSLDQSCSSLMACLMHAYKSIKNGDVEAAIIGGCSFNLHPAVTLAFKRAGFLCMDGKTKSFDKNGDGYVKSDSINAFFLQKAKDAKRIYSEVYHVSGDYSLKDNEKFSALREVNFLTNFFNKAYSNICIAPENVEYIEAFAAGLGIPDFNELEAIGKVFGKQKVIKVGSVKSNMGNSETASGGCSLTKVCLAYYKGEIPANLHYANSPDHIPEVKEGKVQVVTTNTPFNRGITAINCFSYTGSNFHIVLKGHFKEKDNTRYPTSIPYIVLASGRQEQCVSKIFDNLKSNSIDPEQIGLIHNIHSTDIAGHMCRGYLILDKDENKETVSLLEKIDYYPAVTQPVWFVYSGMGSQWVTMGAELMRIPIFAAAIERCRQVLEPRGVDILQILTANNKKIYDNILNSFVGIAAVQIGLTDILNALGIVPDHIIGHSVGELGCAYADGCFTAEEMILAAYSRGLVSVQTPFIRGSMAAVGLGYESVLPLCPPEIDVACHNSSESSTISGPADVMKQFVSELTSRGIFAKEVPCSNIAYHSRYIADAGPQLLKYLKDVITDPKPRSKKWISTSVPQDRWDEPAAQYSSAEYHTNNLLSTVLFEEISKLIPPKALVIEIAPHGLLQAILKRSLPDCTHVPLTRRGHSDPVKLLLESFGRLYQAGLNPRIQELYPRIEFPVSTETQLLSHLVGWEHSENWPTTQFKINEKDNVTATERNVIMSIHDDDYKYFEGNVKDGRVLFPEAALLVLVWETFAMSKGIKYTKFPVKFSYVQFHKEIIIEKELPLNIVIMINKGNHNFEVSLEQSQIVKGNIEALVSNKMTLPDPEVEKIDRKKVILKVEDIYKILQLRGYAYRGKFKSILESNLSRDRATVKFTDGWITFIDSLLQFNAFALDYDGTSEIKLITQLQIDTKCHLITKPFVNGEDSFSLNYDEVLKRTRCGGVQIDGIVFNHKFKQNLIPNVMQTKIFVPHYNVEQNNLHTALQLNMQIIKDNVLNESIKITFIKRNNSAKGRSSNIENISTYTPSFNYDVTCIQMEDQIDGFKIEPKILQMSDVLIVYNILSNLKELEYIFSVLPNDTFVIAIELSSTLIYPTNNLFTIISEMSVGKQNIFLLKKNLFDYNGITYISVVHDNTFSWIPRVEIELQKSKRIVLVSERDPYCGLLGYLETKKNKYFEKLSLLIIEDCHAPPFSPTNKIFKEQLQKNLRINILYKGQWGGYYSIPSKTSVKLQNFKLASMIPGDLDSLTWTGNHPKKQTTNLIKVCYAGPTHADVLKAVGILQCVGNNCSGLGLDFSGIDANGEKVMGFSLDGTISSTVEPFSELMWPVPEHWSLEDAATVPFPYILAYYCVAIKTKIQMGSSIFVTGGAGALGQAVISICTALDCIIYTTVSDVKKKRFLLKIFPKLNAKNIGCSYDDAFHDTVIQNSKNKCCEIVINCSNEMIRESAMKCVAMCSYFCDLSNNDTLKTKNVMSMSFLEKEKNYARIQLSHLFKPENKNELLSVQYLIAEGIAKGIVRPLSRVVYSPADVTKAFRLVSARRHRGRVLIRMNNPLVLNQGLQGSPKAFYSQKGSYIVICNDPDLGVEVSDRLIRNGARNIIMHFNTKNSSGYLSTKLIYWRSLEAVVKFSYDNLNTNYGCNTLIEDSSRLGPVNGIFIVLNKDYETANISDEKETFVDKWINEALPVVNLDLISRKMCYQLAYFVVLMRTSQDDTISYNSSVIERIIHSRKELGLPALAVLMESLEEFNTISYCEDSRSLLPPLPISTALNGLDISLALKLSNVKLHNLKQETNMEIISKIVKIIGLRSIDEVHADTTLGEFLISNSNIAEIKTILKLYHINYSNQKIKQLSISSLKQISQNPAKQNTKFDIKLGAFYTYIEKDENVATDPMICMPTLLSKTLKVSEEGDLNKTYLFLIPGFEGHHQKFTSICERLKVNARVLQLGPDMTTESIPKITENLMKFLKERFEFRSKFYLLGYSFGVNIALELAHLLEKDGHLGVVYCLDSSPVALRAQIDAYLGNLSDSELQNTILDHMYRLMTGTNNDELRKRLKQLETWNDKIEACLQRLRGVINYSNEYKRSIFETALRRITLAKNYEPDFKLKSQIVLMKGIPHPDQEELLPDYDLSKYSTQSVRVFNLNSDHALVPQDCRVSNIINKFIEPQVLKEFNKQNLCETYVISPFMNLY